LIDRRGDVVSKEEIMAAVWPRMAVEEANLFVRIAPITSGAEFGLLVRVEYDKRCLQYFDSPPAKLRIPNSNRLWSRIAVSLFKWRRVCARGVRALGRLIPLTRLG
jgi:hypothetical protein